MDLFNFLFQCTTAGGEVDIPDPVANLIKTVIFLIKVVVPVILIIWGLLDFVKGVTGQDEEKIKAGQKKFIQRLIAAAIVFLIVTIVQIVITTVGNISGDGTVWECAKQLVS